MKFTRPLTALGVVAAVALPLLIAGPAQADEAATPEQLPQFALQALTGPDDTSTSTFTVPAGKYTDAAGKTRTFAAQATWVCNGKTDNPHWSKGAASVIAKTRVTCKGPTATVPIRVESLLGRTTHNSINSLQIVAESNYVQNVAADPNGLMSQTWYVPAQGSATHIARNAYFRGSHSGQAAPPLKPFNIGAAASAFLYVP
ncbi:hypothetical protein NY588_09485 [Curtobacterium flaccumfaciens pv. beticola]|uniref:hypothetical protein n=1 Tax=Curtobacterium flaccumfaciens TaxID=2035 RepID=UPI00349F3A21|nr:hypothetical protein [Curtobacterium flaccumfaciens pv. basellae]